MRMYCIAQGTLLNTLLLLLLGKKSKKEKRVLCIYMNHFAVR